MDDAERVKFCMRVAGVSQATASRWKTGPIEPSRKNLKKIAKALGSTITYLQEGEGPRANPEPGSLADRILTETLALDEDGQIEVLEYVRFRRARQTSDRG